MCHIDLGRHLLPLFPHLLSELLSFSQLLLLPSLCVCWILRSCFLGRSCHYRGPLNRPATLATIPYNELTGWYLLPWNIKKFGEGGGEAHTCLPPFALPQVHQHVCAAAAVAAAVASSVPPTPWPDGPADISICLCVCRILLPFLPTLS